MVTQHHRESLGDSAGWTGSPWWCYHLLGVPGCEAGSTWLQSPPMREVAGVNAPLGDLRPWRQETPGAQKIRGSPACPSPTTFPPIARSLSLHSRPTSGLQCPWEAASVMTPDSCAPTTKPPPPRPPPPPLRLPPPPETGSHLFGAISHQLGFGSA